MSARFGPAGNSEAFSIKYKTTLQAPGYLEAMRLDHYEYQCGRGVKVSDKIAFALKDKAKEHNITLSLHAPYFISLSSLEAEKRDNSINYILQSCDAASRMGADRIVIHSGSCAKISREDALELAKDTLTRARKAAVEQGFEHIVFCPETMGKVNQLGNLTEVLELCKLDDTFLPTIDFGHLNAREFGYIKGKAEYEKMLEDSVYSTGNNARIKQVIQNARDGKDVTLAYIGGSITEGALAKPNSMCYAEVSAKTFGAKYGKNNGENVHFINAGMSGTPSDIGVVRYNRDVIDRLPEGNDHPDVLFIEFAVNDYGTATAGKGYEGLIRQALKSGSAVVLVFSVFQKASGGVVCENDYRPFGTHYDLPMISMGNAISSYFDGNDQKAFYKWYFGDSLHPNNTGYQLMADCITRMFDKMDKETAEEDNITDMDAMAPVKSSAYQGMKMLDSKTDVTKDNAITSFTSGGFNQNDNATGSFQYEYKGQKGAAWFPDNWMHTSTSGTDALKLKVKCKALTLIYKLSNSVEYGSADLYVDGKLQATLSGYDTSGWNNGKVYVAIEEDAEAEHTIELRMNDESESKKFTLMAIGYN